MSRSVLIGIDVRGHAERVESTLRAIEAHTPEPHQVLTLEEGVSLGSAAAFNRLVAHSVADVYVFLECGAQPAPGWLRRILSALDRIPQAGLAGPSANRAWNRQGVLPAAAADNANAFLTARAIERRFGESCRLLEPLHSLSDFCYAVKREVIDAIGSADESYGLGPCWEMDYNVRAHRAGFKGIWVCGAYVHRAPLSPRRAEDDARLFEASRHRYQDKFCGLHLRGLKHDYRDHCRGDACPHFAPRDLIAIRPSAEPAPTTMPRARSSAGKPELPLASCIMPTCNRRDFIPAALACFLAQDYPNLELIVVDDGTDAIRDLLPDDRRIRYIRPSGKSTVGAKRNIACAEARGEYIVHWDDDDWYGPDRVRRQIAALAESQAQACGSRALYYYAPATNLAFRYEFQGEVAAWMGALVYPKRVWEAHPFEPVQIAEDIKFLARIPPSLRIDLKDPSLSVATIHSENTSPKLTTGSFWIPEDVSKIRALIGPPPGQQIVSCIMPTWNRRAFIPLALNCFRAQTYAAKELVIVDDGDDPVGDLVEHAPGIRYIRVNRRASIGAKRNIACEAAAGNFIAHWDDDDWYSPDRLTRQVQPLAAGTHDITGLTNRYLLEMPAGHFWNTTHDVHRRMFVGDIHGGTIVYRKNLWREGARYPDANLAEDAAFIRRATSMGKRILRIENTGEFVYLRHGANTWKFESGRFLDPSGWRRGNAPDGFTLSMLEAYRNVSTRS